MQLATESLRLINLRYQGGESTVLEVADAQNTLTKQQRLQRRPGAVPCCDSNIQTLTGKF